MAKRFCAPIDCTELFLMTNSPGVNIAGTLSVFPLPGTMPPLLKPSIFPKPLAANLPAMPIPIAPMTGIKGLRASANLVAAVANLIIKSTKVWNPLVAVIDLKSSLTVSVSLCILTMVAFWAVCASLSKEPDSAMATALAFSASENC